jgi:hypothetical protein
VVLFRCFKVCRGAMFYSDPNSLVTGRIYQDALNKANQFVRDIHAQIERSGNQPEQSKNQPERSESSTSAPKDSGKPTLKVMYTNPLYAFKGAEDYNGKLSFGAQSSDGLIVTVTIEEDTRGPAQRRTKPLTVMATINSSGTDSTQKIDLYNTGGGERYDPKEVVARILSVLDASSGKLPFNLPLKKASNIARS